MANHKQALKRHRQSQKARSRNMQFRTRMKTSVKKVLAAQEEKKGDVAQAMRAAESMIRHVAAKGVIPKKRASRKVARLARRIHAAQA